MNIKILKLIILMLFLMTMPTLAQSNNAAVINKYNSWLKKIQLDKLVNATDLKSVKTAGVPNNSVTELVLVPSTNFTDAQDMATAWNYVNNGLQQKGVNIYTLLLNKLADYTDLSIENLKITCKSTNNTVFSLDFFFDEDLNLKNNHISEVMGGDLNLNYDFEAAINNIATGRFVLKGTSVDLTRYYEAIVKVFSKYKHEAGVGLEAKKEKINPYVLRFQIKNLYGQITGAKYHERIRLFFYLADTNGNNSVVAYELAGYCAGGMAVIPQNDSDYSEIEKEYPGKMKAFNNELQKQLKDVFK